MLMRSQKVPIVVTPAKAGVQNFLNFLDSRFHGNDRKGRFRTFYEAINSASTPMSSVERDERLFRSL